MTEQVNILAIESSCDETAAAVVRNSSQILSSVVASQIKLHEKYGGVVPEIACRAHVDNIYPVVSQAIEEAGLDSNDIDAIAVASRPGLAIALMVGVVAAKTLAMMWDKPLIGINHIHAHLHSAIMQADNVNLPAVAMVVSGGHSSLYDYSGPLDLKLLGSTIDDAAGEAFDKVSAMLGLGYPGGPAIERAAEKGNPQAIKFPRSMLSKDSLDFSFSGLKTAVLYHCHGQNMLGQNQVPDMADDQIADIAASFQEAVVDVLVAKANRAVKKIKAKTVLLGGGVGANTLLRDRLEQMCESNGLKLFISPKKYCTDNAVMIGSLAYHRYLAGLFDDLTLDAQARA